MMTVVITWIANSLAIYAVAYFMRGVEVASFRDALLAGALLSIVNALVKPVIVLLTLPLTIVTLGLFWWIINALMLWFASVLVHGFVVRGFFAAFFGAIVLALVNMVLRWILPSGDEARE